MRFVSAFARCWRGVRFGALVEINVGCVLVVLATPFWERRAELLLLSVDCLFSKGIVPTYVSIVAFANPVSEEKHACQDG